MLRVMIRTDTYNPPETNIAPQNGWFEDQCPFGMAHVQGLYQFSGGYIVYHVHYLYNNMCNEKLP